MLLVQREGDYAGPSLQLWLVFAVQDCLYLAILELRQSILECTYVVGSSYHFCEESIRFYDWIFTNLIYLDERLAAQENCKRVAPGCCHPRERASGVQGKSLVKADAVAVQFCAVFNCSLGQHQVVRVRYRLQQVLELRDVQRNTCEFVLPQIFV